jgi:cellulose synthase/poly-beta-1,6-N-acetylglucosamine synthase-like glycosyltransferase
LDGPRCKQVATGSTASRNAADACAPGIALAYASAVRFAVALFIFIVFLNRYVFGLYLRLVRGRKVDDKALDYEPTVTIVVPLFNEGPSIYQTIASLWRLDYPQDKLAVIVVDDVSTDDSYEWACKGARDFPNTTVLRNERNMGKRRGINRAVRASTSEIIVSVDSDVIVFPTALRELVSRFTSPQIAAVGGRIHIANPNETWLTRMFTIKNALGAELLRNLERGLEQVMCLSGCLTAYRRTVLLELDPILEHRNILGVSIKYGEDRFLTHLIVKRGYKTRVTMGAMCFSKAPPTLKQYFSQQLRWRRSNIVDYLWGLTHAWKFHPLLCIHYLAMALVLFACPLVLVTRVIEHEFLELAVLHIGLVVLLAVVYQFAPSERRLPPWLRVHPLWFLPMSVLMPLSYILLTPLGLLTLDSSSWETRGHQAAPPPPSPDGPR